MFVRLGTEGDLNGVLEIERLSFPIGGQWDRTDFQEALMEIREVELDVEIVKRGAIQLYEALGFKIARGIPMVDNNTMDDENGSYYLMKMVVNES